MCGIAGFVDRTSHPSAAIIDAMTSTMTHRGPDDHGSWYEAETGVVFGHRRLAILDLSASGHQPMHSPHGRFVITFNGEIYNYQSIAEDLRKRGHRFQGRSDTEVMLAAFEEWGVDAALKKFNGMFAFALWDRSERVLILARDRMGEKPLYYGWNNGIFFFASELKAVTAHPDFTRIVDRDAVATLMRYSYIPAPWSIYRNIFKLIPGTVLRLKECDYPHIPESFSPFASFAASGVRPQYYWHSNSAHPFEGSEQEAEQQLDQLLRDSVKIRTIADVPVGAFLSGGIDSSMTVALMQQHSEQPVRTFSVGFHDAQYNEAQYAKAVADHLGTQHTELYLSPQDVLDVVPLLPQMFDEPFADSSQIPTYLVSKLCSQHVKVSLSGDGGDELFGGYARYPWADAAWKRTKVFPYWLRKNVADLIHSVPPDSFEHYFKKLLPYLPRRLRTSNFGQKMHTLGRTLNHRTSDSLYQGLISHWEESQPLVLNSRLPPSALSKSSQAVNQSFVERMMSLDMVSYLPDDIMVKVDRASMAVSLEARAPFLDHRLVEFVSSLPLHFKLDRGISKKLLRNVLYRYVPKHLVERPKMGFAIPIAQWLRTDLRAWAEELLSPDALDAQGFLRSQPIRQKWNEHLTGKQNWEHYLWDILMFQAWFKAHSSGARSYSDHDKGHADNSNSQAEYIAHPAM